MNEHGSDNGPATIAVLVKIWPKLSETFILEEVLGLERQGMRLRLYSLAAPTDTITHAAVEAVSAPHTRVPEIARSRGTLARCHLRLLVRHPLRYVRTLVRAAAWQRPGLTSFVRAGWLAAELHAHRVRRLHVHFIATPADIAELAAALAAIPFSISAHAKDIFLSDRAALRRKLLAAQFTVTCTEHNRLTLAAIAPTARVLRMYHGVDHGVFHPRARRAAPDVPVLLAIGRLRAKKGLDTLIAACAQLRDQGVAFRCEIVGYGEEHARLTARIAAADLGEQVRLLGKLARADVLACYARATLFVQPSRIAADGDRDGVPNVLLEAMAMSIPVIASRVSGIPELVRDNVNGLLIEPQDAGALAAAIRHVLADPAQAARWGEAARATVIESFDNDRNLRLLTALLEARNALDPCCAPA